LFKEGSTGEALRFRFLDLIAKITDKKPLPVILKNIRHYDKILDLHNAVPEVKFLRVRRNPLNVVISVLKAYEDLGVFHPYTNEMEAEEDIVLKACIQIKTIERSLDEQLGKMPMNSKMEISYEEFCDAPKLVVERFAREMLGCGLISCLQNMPEAVRNPNARALSPNSRIKKIEDYLRLNSLL
jgi:hypothetical protein